MITIVGAGSLGGPLALEIARAGAGAIDLVDSDVFDVNNGVRHVLTVDHAGRFKAEAVAELAARANPLVSTRAHVLQVGGSIESRQRIHDLISASAVVVDATGSAMVTDALWRHCMAEGVPLIMAAITPGGVGGRVVAFKPGGGCPECFRIHQRSGSIPMVPEGILDHFTPYGCSHPAASCAGFDTQEVIAATARMTVQTAAITDYPTGPDWIVLKLRAAADRWHEGKLPRHPECPVCPA